MMNDSTGPWSLWRRRHLNRTRQSPMWSLAYRRHQSQFTRTATTTAACRGRDRCSLFHGVVIRCSYCVVMLTCAALAVDIVVSAQQQQQHQQQQTPATVAAPEDMMRRPTKRRVAKMEGDIILGALFPVHREPSIRAAFTRQCGEIWEQYGMHRIEVFLRTLDAINADQSILPNITLGSDIRDSCWYAPVALEQSIDFIKNSIASLETHNSSGHAGTAGQFNSSCTQRRDKPIAGLIGPGSSTVTIQVQNLLSIFNIPQIGYSATSSDLSGKSLYRYFLRVVPSDKLQAQALAEFVHHFGWNFISTVYTDGNYGLSGMKEFSEMAKAYNICEATTPHIVSNNANDTAFDKVIEKLNKNPNARVVVCFCEGMTIRKLGMAARRKGLDGQFMFIGSDGWNTRNDVVDGYEDSFVGGVSIKLYSPEIPDFDKYYFSLSPNNSRNPWFQEYWQEKFHCYIDGSDRDDRFSVPCNGSEDLKTNHTQDAKLGFVVNAIYTMAHALHAMHRNVCGPDFVGLCDAMNPINGTLFLDYLLNVSFISYSGDVIEFNAEGDPPARYEIMNYQRKSTNLSLPTAERYAYVRIGSWQNGNLTVNDSEIYWPKHGLSSNSTAAVESYCSKPCPHGSIKQIHKNFQCCWVCIPCQSYEYLLNEHTCRKCPEGWHPNDNLTACIMNVIEQLEWNSTEAVIAMSISVLGLIVTGWVTVVFCLHNNTPVVKASTRELSYIILFGIALSYTATFVLIAKPTAWTCGAGRVIPGVSFSMIYGALVTKTNRIARILAGSKKKIITRKPRFMSASAQVVLTIILMSMECAIVGTSLGVYGGAESILIHPTPNRTRLTCSESTPAIVAPFGFDAILIVLCTVYAVKTRNLPENFNEAKFIGFTMYTTCVIWVAFVLIYFSSDNKSLQVISKCLATSFSATVALILLFMPKIYIIIYHPERNNRSSFTTAKGVRCHIGISAMGQRSLSTSGDSLESTRITNAVSPNAGTVYNPWKSSGSAAARDSAHLHDTANHGEQRFGSAAMTVYRQWNFLSRWKKKRSRHSNADVISQQQKPTSSTKVTSGTKAIVETHVDLDMGGGISAAVDDVDPGRRLLHLSKSFSAGSSAAGLIPFTNKSSNIDDASLERLCADNDVVHAGFTAAAADDGHCLEQQRRRRPCQRDCSVQTSSELLNTLLTTGLRHRRRHQDPFDRQSEQHHHRLPLKTAAAGDGRYSKYRHTVGSPSSDAVDEYDDFDDDNTSCGPADMRPRNCPLVASDKYRSSILPPSFTDKRKYIVESMASSPKKLHQRHYFDIGDDLPGEDSELDDQPVCRASSSNKRSVTVESSLEALAAGSSEYKRPIARGEFSSSANRLDGAASNSESLDTFKYRQLDHSPAFRVFSVDTDPGTFSPYYYEDDLPPPPSYGAIQLDTAQYCVRPMPTRPSYHESGETGFDSSTGVQSIRTQDLPSDNLRYRSPSSTGAGENELRVVLADAYGGDRRSVGSSSDDEGNEKSISYVSLEDAICQGMRRLSVEGMPSTVTPLSAATTVNAELYELSSSPSTVRQQRQLQLQQQQPQPLQFRYPYIRKLAQGPIHTFFVRGASHFPYQSSDV